MEKVACIISLILEIRYAGKRTYEQLRKKTQIPDSLSPGQLFHLGPAFFSFESLLILTNSTQKYMEIASFGHILSKNFRGRGDTPLPNPPPASALRASADRDYSFI